MGMLLLLVGFCAPALALGAMLVRREHLILRALGLMTVGISSSGLVLAGLGFVGLSFFG